jgi:FAD/FMN-containing dehydrogenase
MTERFDRRAFVLRGAGALGAGAVLVGPPLAPARAAGDPRLAALSRVLDGDLVARGDPRYAQAHLLWNPRFDGVRPVAIAYAATLEDVRRVIRWATKYDVHLATRSGGHSFAGYSTTTGLVVDLSRLSVVHLNADQTAAVGAGAKLGAVYARLWSAGRRTVPFGTCSTVGVSGLTLGGGHGFSSRALGLACDNVTGIELVTADARHRICNERVAPDLFWALRGAGAGNFGIVTKLVFRTHPVASVTTVNLRWSWADARRAIQAWQAFAPSAPDGLSCVLSLGPTAKPGTAQIGFNGQFFGTRAEALSLIAPLTQAVPPTKVAAVERPFIVAVKYFAAGEPPRRAYVAKSNYGRSPLPAAGLDALVGAVEAAARDPRLAGTGVLLFAHGGAINRVARDATAFVHRDALFSIRYTAFWNPTAPGDAVANLAWVRQTHAAMRPYVTGGAVANYVDPDLRDFGAAYYGSHLKRLSTAKRRYDPDNVFRFPQSIPIGRR